MKLRCMARAMLFSICVVVATANPDSATAGWVENGVPLSAYAGDQEQPVAISDGAGGAFLAWEDDRVSAGSPDVYAQRIDGEGNALWTPGGVLVCGAIGASGRSRRGRRRFGRSHPRVDGWAASR